MSRVNRSGPNGNSGECLPPPLLSVASPDAVPNEFLDFLPAAVYVCNADGTIQRFNRRAAELWGREPGLGDPSFRFCGSLRMHRVDGGPLPHDESPMADVLRNGVAVRDQEIVFERPDASQCVALAHINALRDHGGAIVGAISCFYDISEHKRREREQAAIRREMEVQVSRTVRERERFRALIDVLPAAVYTTDADGRITSYNEAAADLWGRRPALGTPGYCGSWRLFHTDGTPMPHDQCPMALALKERRPVHDQEAIAERPDGTRVRFHPYPTPLFDEAGDLAGAVNMLLDVSERTAAELARHQLAAIVESSSDAIVSKNLNGIVKSWNKGAEHLFGYTAAEMTGRPIAVLIPPERQDEEPDILARISRGERIEHYETQRRRKDGRLVDISLTVSPIRDADGTIIGASKIARDITEHKEIQARQALLAREINHRTKNLFAVVQSVVNRSFAGKKTLEEARADVVSRLHALSQTHTMLVDRDWQGADLRDVILSETSPYGDRIESDGPAILLNPKAAQNFALALHELATNAVKHGALSKASGRVLIRWSRGETQDADFAFCWQERDGPSVTPPTRKGFGTAVLEQIMAEYFDGPPRVVFAQDGVRYELRGPLQSIAAITPYVPG